MAAIKQIKSEYQKEEFPKFAQGWQIPVSPRMKFQLFPRVCLNQVVAIDMTMGLVLYETKMPVNGDT